MFFEVSPEKKSGYYFYEKMFKNYAICEVEWSSTVS